MSEDKLKKPSVKKPKYVPYGRRWNDGVDGIVWPRVAISAKYHTPFIEVIPDLQMHASDIRRFESQYGGAIVELRYED